MRSTFIYSDEQSPFSWQGRGVRCMQERDAIALNKGGTGTPADIFVASQPIRWVPGNILSHGLPPSSPPLVQDLYIIQINGFSAFMDNPHKMIAGRELRGTP